MSETAQTQGTACRRRDTVEGTVERWVTRDDVIRRPQKVRMTFSKSASLRQSRSAADSQRGGAVARRRSSRRPRWKRCSTRPAKRAVPPPSREYTGLLSPKKVKNRAAGELTDPRMRCE